MSQQELLRTVVQALESIGADYMVTGSLVSSLQGMPRSSHDIDVVVAMREEHIDALMRAFPPPEFYLEEIAIRQAIEHESMFNLLSATEGDKVDFWVLTDSPFDQSRFSRRHSEDVFDISIKVSSPEDTILAKLRWAEQSGGSEKQFTDALRVFEVQYETLDISYLEEWAGRLGVGGLLDRLRAEAETP